MGRSEQKEKGEEEEKEYEEKVHVSLFKLLTVCVESPHQAPCHPRHRLARHEQHVGHPGGRPGYILLTGLMITWSLVTFCLPGHLIACGVCRIRIPCRAIYTYRDIRRSLNRHWCCKLYIDYIGPNTTSSVIPCT